MSTEIDLNDALRQVLADASIAPEIAARWPDYRALLIVADGYALTGDAGYAERSLAEVEERIRARGPVDWAAHPHLAAWNEAYRGFGAKPQRTRPSALALIRRVEVGLPRIDPVTNLYNAISVGHVLPIGGEDIAGYEGPPRLVLASGDEPFDTIEAGEAIVDHPAPGEVVWRDDRGVTCRRWNWRQGTRTRITRETASILFILEALGPMGDGELLAAGDALQTGLRILSPDVRLASRLLPSRPLDA